MNIHLPAILMFTRGTRFWHTAIWKTYCMGETFHENDMNMIYLSNPTQRKKSLKARTLLCFWECFGTAFVQKSPTVWALPWGNFSKGHQHQMPGRKWTDICSEERGNHGEPGNDGVIWDFQGSFWSWWWQVFGKGKSVLAMLVPKKLEPYNHIDIWRHHPSAG